MEAVKFIRNIVFIIIILQFSFCSRNPDATITETIDEDDYNTIKQQRRIAITEPCSYSGTTHRDDALDVYWINMDRSISRKRFMENHLSYYGMFEYSLRVQAVEPHHVFIPEELNTPDECHSLLQQSIPNFPSLEKPVEQFHTSSGGADSQGIALDVGRNENVNNETMGFAVLSNCGRRKNTFRELVVTLSHLKALYHALTPLRKDEKCTEGMCRYQQYALIMEDDLQFAFEVNFTELIASAPAGWGVLQLVTSNDYSVLNLWRVYQRHKLHWVIRKPHDDYWCAGAYIINRAMLEPIIKQLISPLNSYWYGAHVIAGYEKPTCTPAVCCEDGILRPEKISLACIRAPRGYQSDNFLFHLLPHNTYMLTIPIVTGAAYGNHSTLHQDHVSYHVSAFNRINSLIQEMKSGVAKLPSYLNQDCMFNYSHNS